MIAILNDPRFFNVFIILMFIAAAIRWAFERNWVQVGYWLSAAGLNICVTIGSK